MGLTNLPPLRVVGRHLVAQGRETPVVLRGINRSGLEYAQPSPGRGFLEAAQLTEADLREMTAAWGANVVRVPFNQDFVLNGRGGRSGADYLHALDTVVAWAAMGGAYTILDLHWLDAETPRGTTGGRPNFVPPLPDAGSVEAWGRIAARYRDQPSVIFDLFNEPHDPLLDDVAPLEGVGENGAVRRLPSRQVSMAEWQPWARRLVDVIRGEHQASLILVSGVRWAFDLRGFPLRDRAGAPIANLVYSTHVYPWSRTGFARVRRREAEWTRAFGWLAATQPVFAAEWGGTGAARGRHLAWGRRLEAYLRARGIGWTAWSWADWPRLVADCRAGDYRATDFGEIVKDALARPEDTPGLSSASGRG